MKIELTFRERWGALVLLAAVGMGSLKEMRIVQAGQGILKVTEEDRKQFKLNDKETPGELSWDEKKVDSVKKIFNIDEQLKALLLEKLKVLDEKKMMQKVLLPLADKLGME